MSRRSTRKIEDQKVQIKDLCFNIYGWALEEGMPDRQRFEKINAYPVNSTPYKDAIKKGKEDELSRPSIAYTVRENAPTEEGQREYLVVGYVPRSLTAAHGKQADGQTKQTPVGLERPQTVIPWSIEPLPLIAVTEVLEERPPGIQLWVLLRPVNGICTPYQVAQKEVFYRSEFRDETTAIMKRGPSWNGIVAEHSVGAGSSGRIPNDKQKTFRQARDTTRVVIEPNESLANEVVFLTSSFRLNKSKWFLDEIKEVLEEADEDLHHRPLAENRCMRKFVESSDDFNAEDAAGLVQEINDIWPEVHDITIESVLCLRQGLHDADIFLEYRLLRGFLAQGCYEIRTSGLTHCSSLMISSLIATMHRILPGPKSMPPISVDQQGALLASLKNKLGEMRDAGKTLDTKLKAICGDQVLTGTVYDYWAEYAKKMDTDAARMAFFQVARHLARAMKHKEIGLDKMAGQIVDVLEKLGLGDM